MAANLPAWETLRQEGPDEIGVVRLVLNRPSKANALSNQMFRELPMALQGLDADPSVRVIILTAAGKHFCAGIDLGLLSKDVSSPDMPEKRREFGIEREAMRRRIKFMQFALTALETCRKPVIAAIHGTCVGAGIDLITACDLRYSTADAVFSVKEVDLALTADLGTLQRLPFIVGYSNAMELALTARNFDGNEAYKLGLSNGVFPSKESLEKGVTEVATMIAEKSPLAIVGTKQVLLKSRELSVADGLDYVANWNAAYLWPNDVQESFVAKKERRKPVFSKL